METVYIVLVGLLILFAVSDLVVGVSNDAVNFLNSAIGAKAAPFWVIMVIASLGVLAGATFSNGMMEVARKGIFMPMEFQFNEIMIIFIAVMITDVILLDTFNTFGMPTSTTVSIVFELLGGAVAVGIFKIMKQKSALESAIANGETELPEVSQISDFINTDKAMLIIFGILLSVVIAFSVGAIIQWISRFVFTFNYKTNFKYFGAIFGGIAVTSITYFLLIKGAKNAPFMTGEMKDLIKGNTWAIVGMSFVAWTVLLQLLHSLFKFNILRFCVLAGTFSLAMAFAGNDLVNFIGVPLAGLESFNLYEAAGGDVTIAMGGLAKKVQTPTVFLLIAGLIMVLTLWISKKARTVTQTSLNLSDQNQVQDQFGSSAFARAIVRSSLRINDSIMSVFPDSVRNALRKRFENPNIHNTPSKDAPSFDMIRATINLMAAGILISIGTSLKLPLSTTYVTFMVAMGTSLSDGAWGRESAVYRITGVLTVIGGWFFTAFSAFTVCGIIAFSISLGGDSYWPIVTAFFILVAVFVVIRSKKHHAKREVETAQKMEKKLEIANLDITKKCTHNVCDVLESSKALFAETVDGLYNDDRQALRKVATKVEELNIETKSMKDNVEVTLSEMQESDIETSHFYVQVLDYIREVAHGIEYITQPAYDHYRNGHKELHFAQKEELRDINQKLDAYVSLIIEIIKEGEFGRISDAIDAQQALNDTLNESRKHQIKRIRKDVNKTRNSILYLSLLHESKSVSLYFMNLLKAHRDFVMLSTRTNK